MGRLTDSEIKHGHRAAYKELVARILDGDGKASQALRRSAFDNSGLAEPLLGLLRRVALQPSEVTDRDFTAAKERGFTDDQLFELVVCAAVGQASRQYGAALAALDALVGAGSAGGAHAP